MTELWHHQTEAVNFILHNKGIGALFHSIGTGKTRTALEIYKNLKGFRPDLKLFVICPLSLIESAWGEDIRRFTPFQYVNLHERTNYDPKDIFITNYESLLTIRLAEFQKLLNFYPFMMIVDESSRMKNHKAKTTRTILSLRNLVKYRVILSGTPAPNSEAEYWAQMTFLRYGIFHERFYPFRSYYFHLERGNVKLFHGQIMTKVTAREMFSQGWKYAITNERRVQLMQRIAPFSHLARKEDCLDLPEQIDEIRMIEMGKKQKETYMEMKRDLITEIKGEMIVAQVALTKIMKLREICSGFAISEQGVRLLDENPKLKELEAILEEIGSEQAIIWCEFKEEIKMIKNLLNPPNLKEKAVCLYGDTKDKEESINAFKAGTQYLIAHPRSAGHGLNFQNCNIQIFYSLSYSYELYDQCRGRTHRAGQKNKCTYIHLLMKGGIEDVILEVLRKKQKATEIVERMVI